MKESDGKIQTVAITGAAGLLGRYLCNYFYSRGWRVHALVRDTSKYPFAREGIKLYKCNLPDTIDEEAIDKADVVIHCAYMTRLTNLEEAKLVNEKGTARLYDLVHRAGSRRFVFVSSTAARPGAESYYAQSKYRLESMMDPSRDLIIRPGLILASDGGLFVRIVNQVKRLPFVPVFGGGQQKLNTVHIEDLCRVFAWAIENRMSGVMTVAESEGVTMKELLRTVLEQLGQHKPIVSVPGRPVVLLLRLLESFKLKLPVSSENLRGLLNRDNMAIECSASIKQSGIRIRQFRESLNNLIQTS